MNANLYFAAVPLALIFFNFWTLKFLFGRICDYVLDKELRDVEITDIFPFFRGMFDYPDHLRGEDLFLAFALSILLSLFWGFILVFLPIILFYYSFIYSLRFLRFIVRLSRGLKQVSSVAHSHNNNEIIKEKINEIKF